VPIVFVLAVLVDHRASGAEEAAGKARVKSPPLVARKSTGRLLSTDAR
jgi:hypothetical protein